MKCWKQDCLEESIFFCKCSKTGIYSCLLHYADHIQLNSEVKHDPESLHLKPNPETKKMLCDYLRERNADLSRFRSKVIDQVSKKIEQIKSQLIIAIGEIERVKSENSALINRIIQVEKVSKSDNLGKFLILKPDVAMKSFQDEICRIDYEKIPDYIEGEDDICANIIKRHEINFFRNNTKKLVRYNLNDQTIKEVDLPIEQALNTNCSICKIPNGNLICFGGCSSYTSAVFMIHPDNTIKYLASLAQPRGYSSSAIYYNNKVYAFGGQNSSGYVLAPEKYNIAKNKWKQLPNLSAGANYCNGFGYKNKIFFAGYHHLKIYIYDIKQNAYSEIPIVLTQGGKALILKENTFYVITAESKIYEFDANNYNKWKIVERSTPIGPPISHIAKFKNSFYFMDNGFCLYKFDLNWKYVANMMSI